jgi:hypothetical protein
MLKSYSQWGYGFTNFEDTSNLYRIEIDTSLSNNIWQIGSPHKSVFITSYSLPNAIVTDTLNPYPVNNNSIFYYRTSGDFNTDAHDATLEFWYKMDSDTLNDFGKVEISIDTGSTWYNLATGSWVVYDSTLNVVSTSWYSNDSIVFTGRTNGWYLFTCDAFLPEMIMDSIIYRFTFHSSGFSTSRDGWMIDDIQFNTWWESVRNLKNSSLVYPNPVKNQFSINSTTGVAHCEIFNTLGRIVKKYNNYKLVRNIDVSDLPSGLYYYKITFENDQESSGKFVKM